ncbi:MAG: S8 family peptidase [Bacteroidota bacterium]
MAKSRLFILLALFLATSTFAQTNRYMVHLTDKNSSPYSVDAPLQFLSQKAVDRRGGAITEEDLPVNPQYINTINAINASTTVFHQSRWFNAVLVEADASDVSTIEALPFVDEVEFVAPGGKLVPSGRTKRLEEDEIGINDQNFEQNNLLGINDMHADGFKGEGILIVVLDGGFTGVDIQTPFAHVFDEGRMKFVWNFVENSDDVFKNSSHGTEVYSTIAAFIDGTYRGVAFKADFMLFTTEDVDSEYRIEEYNWLFAAEVADSAGADIITASVGYNEFDDPSMNYEITDLDGNTAVVTRAASIAASKGMLMVSSAGNEAAGAWQLVTPPSDAENMLAVGSANNAGFRNFFSSIGPTADDRRKPDLAAIGSGTVVINPAGNLSIASGTSFSAPQVAGLAAGLWQANPELTNIELMDLMRMSASNSATPDNEIGFGFPNYNAVQNFLSSSEQDNDYDIFPNPVIGAKINLRVKDPTEQPEVRMTLINTTGQVILDDTAEFTWLNNTFELNTESLTSGLYIMKVSSAAGTEEFRIVRP